MIRWPWLNWETRSSSWDRTILSMFFTLHLWRFLLRLVLEAWLTTIINNLNRKLQIFGTNYFTSIVTARKYYLIIYSIKTEIKLCRQTKFTNLKSNQIRLNSLRLKQCGTYLLRCSTLILNSHVQMKVSHSPTYSFELAKRNKLFLLN